MLVTGLVNPVPPCSCTAYQNIKKFLEGGFLILSNLISMIICCYYPYHCWLTSLEMVLPFFPNYYVGMLGKWLIMVGISDFGIMLGLT
jgi:hypothetical protein